VVDEDSVTTPAPQQPVQQPPPPSGLDDAALAVAVAAVLAGVGGPALTAAATVAALKVRFALTAAAVSALGAVLNVVMTHPHPVTGIIGPASARTSRMNTARRAQYVIAASKRVIGAARDARAKGGPDGAAARYAVGAAVAAQLATERRFFEQHQAAMWARATAAGQIDMEAAVHGDLLGWYARRGDGRTTPDCRKADRHNFYASHPPDIGLPGIGPHVGCRCEAGPPWPGGKLLPGRGLRYARAA
jgi:hypothetical protein